MPLDQVPRALAARDTRGLVKLVAGRATDRLAGAQICAPEGADTIQTMVLALRHGMRALAAQGFAKDVTKLSSCAGRAIRS